MSSLDWEAIGAVGELVGAAAVVVTLIYFALQIRSLKADSLSGSINQIDQGERDLHKLCIEHVELIRKANGGARLSDDELFVLNEIFLSVWAFHFFAFARARTHGRTRRPPAASLARYLRRYPGFLTIYESDDFRSLLDLPHKEFLDVVDNIYSESGS